MLPIKNRDTPSYLTRSKEAFRGRISLEIVRYPIVFVRYDVKIVENEEKVRLCIQRNKIVIDEHWMKLIGN